MLESGKIQVNFFKSFFKKIFFFKKNNVNSPIHDHAGAHCIMKVLSGELLETQYEWPKGHSIVESSDSETDVIMDQSVPNAVKLGTCLGTCMHVKAETALKRNEVAYIHGNFLFQIHIIQITFFYSS
jgi:hypothetical protein